MPAPVVDMTTKMIAFIKLRFLFSLTLLDSFEEESDVDKSLVLVIVLSSFPCLFSNKGVLSFGVPSMFDKGQFKVNS